MLSYFGTSQNIYQADEARKQVDHYRQRMSDFLNNFSKMLPELALAKIMEVSRHMGVSEIKINIVSLAEEYYHNQSSLQNYYISIGIEEVQTLIQALTAYLIKENFKVTQVENRNLKDLQNRNVVELLVQW